VPKKVEQINEARSTYRFTYYNAKKIKIGKDEMRIAMRIAK